MKKYILFFSFISISFFFFAQENALTQKWIKASVPMSQQDYSYLSTNGLIVHGIYENAALVNEFTEQEITILSSMGYQPNILINDMYTFNSSVFNPIVQSVIDTEYPVPTNFAYGVSAGRNGLWTYAEIVTMLDQMRTNYPNLITAKTNSIGTTGYISNHYTLSKRTPIYWVKISDNPDINEPAEAQVFLNAATHGNEGTGLASLVYFMWFALENYNTNAKLKTLIDNTEIYIIPVVNPDGLNENTRGNQKSSTASVDINRNFSYGWSTACTGCNPGTAAFSEPETQLVRDMYNTHTFNAVQNLHSYFEGILYPYSCDPSLNPAQCTPLAGPELTIYQKLNDFYRANNYYKSGSFFTILGYAGPGSVIDWMYKGNTITSPVVNKANYKSYATLPECGTSHWYSNINDGIRVCQEMMHTLMGTVRLAGNYAEAFETGSTNITSISGAINFNLKRFGLEEGGIFTVNCVPISSNITFGSAVTFNSLTKFQTTTGTITYTVLGANNGDLIKYKLTVNNGRYTTEEIIEKAYNGVNLYTSGISNLSDANLITTSNVFSLSGYNDAALVMDLNWDLKRTYTSTTPGTSNVIVEASNNGTTWTTLSSPRSTKIQTTQPAHVGLQADIVRDYFDLGAFANQTNVRFRTRLTKSGTGNTFTVANIAVYGFNNNACAVTTKTITDAACYSYTLNAITYTNSGVYTQTLTNVAGCDSLLTLNLTIKTVNNTISQNGNQLSSNQAGAVYQWLDCNNSNLPINNATVQQFSPTNNGSYAVNVTYSGCAATTTCVNYVLTGLNTTPTKSLMIVYPNPNNGKFTINFGQIHSEILITIRDAKSVIVYETTIKDAVTKDFDLKLTKGFYTITTNKENVISKLIID